MHLLNRTHSQDWAVCLRSETCPVSQHWLGVGSELEVRLSYLSMSSSGPVGSTQWSFQPWPGHRNTHETSYCRKKACCPKHTTMLNLLLRPFYKTTKFHEVRILIDVQSLCQMSGSMANPPSHQPISSKILAVLGESVVSYFPQVLFWKLWLLCGTANTSVFHCLLSTASLIERQSWPPEPYYRQRYKLTLWAVWQKGRNDN